MSPYCNKAHDQCELKHIGDPISLPDPLSCHPPPVVFHKDAPEFLPNVLPIGDECPALLARVDTAHAAPALTKTAVPNPDAPAAVGSGKINLNSAQPTDGKTA